MSRSEADQLRDILAKINQTVGWYEKCRGAVSRDDLTGMLKDILKTIDANRELIWPEGYEAQVPESDLRNSDET